VPLHSEKVGVWCALSPLWIIGPIFPRNRELWLIH
jgi:hypothetical protein